MLKTATAPTTWTHDYFRVLCAWCNYEIKAPKAFCDTPPPESHGICVACAVNLGMPADYFANVA